MRSLALLLFPLLVAPNAMALGPGEQAVSVDGMGAFALNPERRLGGGAAIAYSRGMTDVVALRIAIDSAWLHKAGNSPLFASQVVAGATFALDALSYVPFVEAGLCGLDLRGQSSSAQWLGTQAGAGMDYLLSRHAGVGVVIRGTLPLLRLAGEPSGGRPFQVSLGFRYVRYF